jgi:hypothetical protein
LLTHELHGAVARLENKAVVWLVLSSVISLLRKRCLGSITVASAEMRRNAQSSTEARDGSHRHASWARAGSFLPLAAPHFLCRG